DNNNGSHKARGYEDGHEKERYGKQARADGFSSCSRDVKEWPFRKRAREYEEHGRKDRDRDRSSVRRKDQYMVIMVEGVIRIWSRGKEGVIRNEIGEVKREEDLKKSGRKEHSHKYQLYILEQAIKNTIPFLETGGGEVYGSGCRGDRRLPLLTNRWKIYLYKGSKIKRIKQIDENFIGFVNEPFTRILDPNNQYHEHDSVDVVGTVVAIGNIIPVNGYGCSKICRTVVIEDADDKLDEVGHLDIVLILGKVKYWNNKPAIHNALFSTRIYINKDITPLKSFRKSYEAQNENNAIDFRIQIHNQENHVGTPAEFMQGSVKRMVGMIRNIEPETHCVVYATIHSIQYENGWAYTGCKACNTKVTAIASKGASSSKTQKQLWHDDITSCEKPSNDGQADGIDTQIELTFIDLSDYETKDKNEACNTIKKVVTMKLEKDP
nr:replication protein A 70 kDa DNA-binding subunit B [Tanacetum cinerariifolium]